jgi:hypothetical protein
MALEYRLTLAGEIPTHDVATRAFPDPAERPTPYEDILSANLDERRGFQVDVMADQNSYYGSATDTGRWEWEPPSIVDVTFRMDRDPERREAGLPYLLKVVARLLASGPEDAAFMINGDTVLLTRVNGAVCKHHRSWWDHYHFADEIIPG